MNAVRLRPLASASSAARRVLLGSTGLARGAVMALAVLACGIALTPRARAQALPTGSVVTAGLAKVTQNGNSLTVHQSSQSAAINWDSFNIAAGNSVTFVQPSSSAVALNRVTGPDASQILGNLSANGSVFLVNPNGVLFGAGSQVNVGGLVASSANITDANFMAGNYKFTGSGKGSILNQGTINAADGGYVALLGANVANDGTISARLGSVVMAGGNAFTLDVAGDNLLSVVVDGGAVGALVRNGGLIRADGGSVLMSTQAADLLLGTVVNNTGVIEARTIDTHTGTIRLLADADSGTVNLSGTLDASAAAGGNGGAIETSAAHVNVADTAVVSTLAPQGATGTWLIDPQDFIVGAGGNISGSTLSAMLVTNSVTISTLATSNATVAGTPPVTTLGTTVVGNGDIIVNDAIAWTASSSATTLRLNAFRDIVFNNAVSATNGNIVACCGRDVVVNAALTTTNGSILLNAGNNVTIRAALTTTDGNIALCAGENVDIGGAITLTRGTTIPSQSLGLNPGLLIIAGSAGTGPGPSAGTLIFQPLTPPITVTGPNAPVVIDYNPVSYAAPSDFSPYFTLSQGASVAGYMLVFPASTKVADGTTATTLTGFNTTVASGLPVGVTLVANSDATAAFDSADAGTNVGITYSGYSLAGANAGRYVLAASCCVTTLRTQGTITPAAVVTTPVVTTPVVTTPVVTTPVVTTPVITTPVVTTPVITTPVVTTPVVTTPVITTPVITTPVVTTPVVTTPVVTTPVVTTPVVTTPVVTTPVVTIPVITTPVVTTPVITTPVITTPVITTPVITTPAVISPAAPSTPSIVAPVVSPLAGGWAPAYPAGTVVLAMSGAPHLPSQQLETLEQPTPLPVAQPAPVVQVSPVAAAQAPLPARPRFTPKQDRN